jgi:CBS domain-containing protein
MKIPTAADFMHRDVACARPDQSLEELASFLTEEDVHGAPVVGDDGKLIGIVSRSDVVRAMAESQEDQQPQADPDAEAGLGDGTEDGPLAPTPAPRSAITAREIMSSQVVTSAPAATPGQIADLMADHKIHRVVILDHGKVVGLVSISDLLPLISGYEKSLNKANLAPTRAVPRKPRLAKATAARPARKPARKTARKTLRRVVKKTSRKTRAAGGRRKSR